MIITNIFNLVLVWSSYFFLFVLTPFWIRGYRLTSKDMIDKLMSSFLIGNTVIVNVVFLLSFINLYSRTSLIICLLLCWALYRVIFKRTETAAYFKRQSRILNRISTGYLHKRELFKSLCTLAHDFIKNLSAKFNDPVYFALVIIVFSFAFYYRSYHSLTNYYYGSSDMYLHTEWVKYLVNGVPFKDGIYPFAFHNVVAAASTVFGLNIVVVMQMIGPMFGLLIVFALYRLLTTLFKSRSAVLFGLIFYCVSATYNDCGIAQQIVALPQMYGMMFLYVVAYYLHKYLNSKQQSDLVAFSLSLILILASHFYIAIYAAVICVTIILASLNRIEVRVVIGLSIGLVCIGVVAGLPYLVGLLTGSGVNVSLKWALHYVQGTDTVSFSSGIQNLQEAILNHNFFSTLASSNYFSTSNYAVMSFPWLIVYLISFITGIALSLTHNEHGRRRLELLGILGFSAFSLIILVAPVFGFPSLMEYERMTSFFIYSVPLVLAMMIDSILFAIGRIVHVNRRIGMSCTFMFCMLVIAYLYYSKNIINLSSVHRMQYNSAVGVYYDIVSTNQKGTWTIVSSTDEYSQCLLDGYHVEASYFALALEEKGNDTIYIPTENVFFYIIKRPIAFLADGYEIVHLGTDETEYPEIDLDDAKIAFKMYGKSLTSNGMEIYKNYELNRILQAKILSWAEEYKTYFPNEMSVYYEDNVLIVYRIKQNLYAPNNFYIQYAGNSNE